MLIFQLAEASFFWGVSVYKSWNINQGERYILNEKTRRFLLSIQKILQNLTSQNKIILISFHILNTLENICDKIHFLNIKKLEATYDRLNYNPPQTTP
jgi:hypothetical protein